MGKVFKNYLLIANNCVSGEKLSASGDFQNQFLRIEGGVLISAAVVRNDVVNEFLRRHGDIN